MKKLMRCLILLLIVSNAVAYTSGFNSSSNRGDKFWGVNVHHGDVGFAGKKQLRLYVLGWKGSQKMRDLYEDSELGIRTVMESAYPREVGVLFVNNNNKKKEVCRMELYGRYTWQVPEDVEEISIHLHKIKAEQKEVCSNNGYCKIQYIDTYKCAAYIRVRGSWLPTDYYHPSYINGVKVEFDI